MHKDFAIKATMLENGLKKGCEENNFSWWYKKAFWKIIFFPSLRKFNCQELNFLREGRGGVNEVFYIQFTEAWLCEDIWRNAKSCCIIIPCDEMSPCFQSSWVWILSVLIRVVSVMRKFSVDWDALERDIE